MIVTVLNPPINLTERGAPKFTLGGFGEEAPSQAGVVLPASSDLHTARKPVVAPPRSPGLHVSSLIKSIALKSGLLKSLPAQNGRFKSGQILDETDFPLVMAMGMAWEDWISLQYPEMVYHPGELELDGVAGSPDGITLFPALPQYTGLGEGIIEEFKLTYKSARKDISDPANWMWLCQVKAYCKMLPSLCARIHVLYVNGDYSYDRPGMPCMYRIYCVQFTQQEVDSNWAMLMSEKESALRGELAK